MVGTKYKSYILTLMIMLVLLFTVNQLRLGQVTITSAAESQNTQNSLIQTNSLSLPDLYSKVRNSVVQVSSTVGTLDGEGTRLGSGFVYDNEGHVITNYHVVETNSRKAQFDVAFSDGNSYMAHVVGTDPYSDLAVLKLEGAPDTTLIPLPIANSSQLQVGDSVIAIGNPFGLAGSMTTGIVSGLSRILPSGDEAATNPLALSFSIPNIIQTDAAINPGNSGGPLLNSNGEVIGINTAIYSDTGVYSGVGFAVPSDTILRIVPSLIRIGTYQHPYLGVAGSDITPSLARQLGLKEARGFLITNITPGGPADKSGLQAAQLARTDTGTQIASGGDIITKIDDKTVNKIDDVLSYLETHSSVGDTVHLTVNSDGVIKNVNVVLEARPSQQTLQKVAAEKSGSGSDFGSQLGNGDDSLYNQCKRFGGEDFCGFFFGR